MSQEQTDPLVSGVRSAVGHLGKAGFEVLAALGALATGLSRKIRSDHPGDNVEGGPERVEVD
jgi:hypothetical protein